MYVYTHFFSTVIFRVITSSNNDSPSFRGLRYPDVSFKYEGADGDTDETCRMPTKAVGPYIVVDTIPGRCQMYVLLYTKFSEVAIWFH